MHARQALYQLSHGPSKKLYLEPPQALFLLPRPLFAPCSLGPSFCPSLLGPSLHLGLGSEEGVADVADFLV